MHRYAIVVAGFVLVLVISGAAFTTSNTDPSYYAPHWITAAVTGVLVAGLAVRLISRGWRRLGWLMLAALIADVALAAPGALQTMPVTTRVLHSCLAQLLLAASAAAVLCTSRGWNQDPVLAADSGWPSLRSLAVITPVFVLGQVFLGAAFRHKALGLMPHIVGAMIVAVFILMVCIFVTQQFGEHAALKPAANTLLAVAGAQVFLGIAAVTVLMIVKDPTPTSIAITVAHVTNGGATLAASVLLGMQIRRNVYKQAEEDEESTSDAVSQ